MKNILIVDDSKLITSSVETMVKKQLNLNCIIASSMKEAADKMLEYKGKFAVALLDLGLPDAPDGEIVDLVTKFNIPTIVLTGSYDTKNEVRFRDKNIVDYVIKDSNFSIHYAVSVIKRIVSNYNLKILIVDDSKSFLEKACDLVSRYQLEVFRSTNGQEALEVLDKHPDIKIVFTDYNMPKIDGLELTKLIRKKYTKDELSIIVTSNDVDKTVPAKFLKYGANDFIYKGFTNEEFYARLNSSLEMLELFEDAKNKANKDFLTGLYNRRYLFEEGLKIYEENKNDNKDFALAIIDIDKFKNINDTYGHDVGDVAIQEVGKIVSNTLDKDCFISRMGGEEFCVLIYNKSKDEYKELFEKIRTSFVDNIVKVDDLEIMYTVSIGCSFNYGKSLDEMIQFADKGLYDAKENGRNQVRYR